MTKEGFEDCCENGDCEECEPFENYDIIRAKWQMDGAESLAEAAEKLRTFALFIDSLVDFGWTLDQVPVTDDYAFIRPPEGMKVSEAWEAMREERATTSTTD